MDEDRLTEAFHDAADHAERTAPPAGFDHADVLAWSARATRRAHRRRMGVVAGAVVVVAAGGLVTAGADAPEAARPFALPFAEDKRAAASSCAVPDQQLFAQLGELLPAVRGATPRPLGDAMYCPDGGRGVEVDVSADGARGTLRVLLAPPGSLGGGSSIQTGGGSQSTSTVSVHGGGSLSLSSQSDDGSAPYDDELDDLADQLADRNAH